MHYCEGGYDRIAPKLFNELNVDCYYVSLCIFCCALLVLMW